MLLKLLSVFILVEGSLSTFINLNSRNVATIENQNSTLSCPTDIPLSCSNSTPIENSCCFESPGGILLLTQFWDYDPPIGGNETFTLHGLWPDNCDGTYGQFCDDSLNISNATDIVLKEFDDQELYDKMIEYWKNNDGNDESLWIHEFNKHATCVNTIKPSCYDSLIYKKNENVHDYFTITMNLYQKLPTFEFLAAEGIVPSLTQKYTKKQIDDALTKHFGKSVYFSCNKDQALQEIWYYHYLQGPLKGENFHPIDTIVDANCPDEGIQFIPKSTSSTDPQPSNSTVKGYLESPGKDGCLISNGKWYVSGTCATYTISQLPFGAYNIQSSKEYCDIDTSGQLTCSSLVDPSKSQFQYNEDTQKIGYGGSYDWCLDEGQKVGDGNTAQTPVKISDGQCDAFPIQYGSQ